MSEKFALYRKYRPQSFNELVSQDVATKTLLAASKKDHFSHAYLFSGPRGTGKTSLARLVAKAINCPKRKDGEPCNECDECKSIQAGNHPDLIELDAASHTSVEDIRDLIEKAQFTPSRAKKKIYIIDEAHMLSKSAFNALLKTLEEPPEHVHFILATTEQHKLPVTIVSRCQKFDFRRITEEDIIKQLEKIASSEKIKAEKSALELIARQTQGGLRDAIGLLEQLSENNELTARKVEENLGLTSLPVLEDLLKNLEAKQTSKAIKLINDLTEKGVNLTQFIKDFLNLAREKMIASLSDNQKTDQYLKIIEVFQVAGIQLKQSYIPQLPLEVACVKVCATRQTEANPEQPKQVTSEEKPRAEVKKNPEIAKASPVQKEKGALSTKNWQEVVKKVPNAIIKISLKDSESKMEEGKLTVFVSSNFHFEKISDPSAKREIQKAYTETFNENVEVEVEMKKSDLKAVAPSSKKEEKTGKEKVTIDDISQIFGVNA